MEELKAEKVLKKAYKEAKKFFKIDLPSVKLYLIQDWAVIDNNTNLKRSWHGAGFFRKNAVIVFDKKLYPEIGHNPQEFDGIVLHELSHIFLKEIVKKDIPIWIEEGLCNYISFPEFKPKEILDLKKIVTLDDWYNHNTPFAYCSTFFHFIEKRYSRDKIIKFLMSLNEENLDNALKKQFGYDLREIEKKYREYLNETSP